MPFLVPPWSKEDRLERQKIEQKDPITGFRLDYKNGIRKAQRELWQTFSNVKDTARLQMSLAHDKSIQVGLQMVAIRLQVQSVPMSHLLRSHFPDCEIDPAINRPAMELEKLLE